MILFLTLVALVVVGLVAAAGELRWQRHTRALVRRLARPGAGSQAAICSEAELGGLPPPVARYFRAVLREGYPGDRRRRPAALSRRVRLGSHRAASEPGRGVDGAR